jgi:hypothetical protein
MMEIATFLIESGVAGLAGSDMHSLVNWHLIVDALSLLTDAYQSALSSVVCVCPSVWLFGWSGLSIRAASANHTSTVPLKRSSRPQSQRLRAHGPVALGYFACLPPRGSPIRAAT